MGKLVGLTGTPGTGKKTLAPMLAAKLGLSCIGLNELAEVSGLWTKTKAGREVDTEALRRKLVGNQAGPSLIYGHLLPYVLTRRQIAKVVVLRCEPAVLRRRLMARGYPASKIIENLEAELIGTIAFDAYATFGAEKTTEYDTTRSRPEQTARSALEFVLSKEPPSPRVDWSPHYDSAAKLRSLFMGGSMGSPLT
ncbi:MAG: adenylate kinase family protein [Thaumarchaeota archaeon]|nr:adenylate kinase family protein [Nitrososphaerota archaeon]